MLTLLNIKYPKSRMCCQKTARGQYFSFWYSTVMCQKMAFDEDKDKYKDNDKYI